MTTSTVDFGSIRPKCTLRPCAKAIAAPSRLEGIDVADDAGRGLELVELLAVLIDRLDIAFQRAVEDHVAIGRQCARPDRKLLGLRPDDLAVGSIPGDEIAHIGAARCRIHCNGSADIGLACGVAHLIGLIIHADMVGRHVEEPGLRRIGCRLLVLRAQSGRADARGVGVFAVMLRGVFRHDLRAAVLVALRVHVDFGRPVHCRIIFLGDKKLAGGAIHCIGEAIAIEVDQNVMRLALHVHAIDEDHLVDAVEVPLVMRGHLIHPLGHARIGIACKNGHRPFVVTRALHGIPGRGVAGSVVDEVQLRIEGVPTPGRTAALLPLLAFPAADARVLADGLAELGGLLRIHECFGIGTRGICAPGNLTILEVVCRHVPAHAELAAGYAYEHLVLEHHRSVCSALALAAGGIVAVLRLPDDLARLGIERRGRGVGLIEDDLAVAIGDAAVDGVAAHDRDDTGILLGLIFPKDLAVIVEIKRIDGVRERCMNIHHVADHQRAAFVATQYARGERPFDLQVFDVVLVDLVECRVAGVGIVTRRHRPVLGV
jgi:hypothetical protein